MDCSGEKFGCTTETFIHGRHRCDKPTVNNSSVSSHLMNQGRKRMLECAEECLNMFFGGKISSRNNTIKIKFMQLRDILITDRIYRQFSVFLRHL